jgi:hypothetical protein
LNRARKKVEIIERHLRYEIEMLRYAYDRLKVGGFENQGQINSLIETFCIHARNLIDFFWEDKPESKDEPKATHFASTYPAARGKRPPQRLYGKLHRQVFHLSYKRPIDPQEKFSASERKALIEAIEAEILSFRDHLSERYRIHWQIPSR